MHDHEDEYPYEEVEPHEVIVHFDPLEINVTVNIIQSEPLGNLTIGPVSNKPKQGV